eukprot:scaffold16716_cov146-Skeletonema_dohrnii-CCMP3373.AAC.13
MPQNPKYLPSSQAVLCVVVRVVIGVQRQLLSAVLLITQTLYQPTTMEHRDYDYYEAHAAGINLEEITSSAENAKILQQLRDGVPMSRLNFRREEDEGDDMGWWGYFIGKSEYLQILDIRYLPDGEEGHAFVEGIARNQSIRYIIINNLNNDGFTWIMRASRSLPQLERLTILGDNNVGSDGWSEVQTLLESGGCKLKRLDLSGNSYIGNEGLDVLSGLKGMGSSLNELNLENNSIGNEGLSILAEVVLTNCTGLKTLRLSGNDFSSATAGLRSLSDCLQRDEVNVKHLNLRYCRINDEGLLALTQGQGVANHCEVLVLDGNESITATGLSYLSNSIRYESCRVETLHLRGIPIGDDGMEVLALGLAGNKSVRSLYLNDLGDDTTAASAGWLAISRALCDTSSVNSTYLSNHSIRDICDGHWLGVVIPLFGGIKPPEHVFKYLKLNKEHPQYTAKCKILMSHRHLDMTPFLRWDHGQEWDWRLKFLPVALAWFERAKPCTTLTIQVRANSAATMPVIEESREAFESRVLTAMYEFVRGMPMEVMKSRHGLAVATAYDKKIARIEEGNKIASEQLYERYCEALEQRDERYRVASEQLYERYCEALEQRDERYRVSSEQLYERYRVSLEQRDERYREALEQRDRKNLQLEEEIARLKREQMLAGLYKW